MNYAARQMLVRRPAIEQVPGPASGCQRHSCKGCSKITRCRDEFEKPQRQNNNRGD